MTQLRFGAASDVGQVRNSNQDLWIAEPTIFAVADGMGGHAGGEVAARMAVDTLRNSWAQDATLDGLRQAVADANMAIWSQGQVHSDLRGMGTTLTVAALVESPHAGEVVVIANVGDSRAYIFSQETLTQVSADHSLAEEKVRHGELTEAEAAVHPHRHILTRALGIAPSVEVDLWELRVVAGDRILLCSDGLTNEVTGTRIAGVLHDVGEPSEVANQLVEAANVHGGHDNITVVVIDVVEEGSAATPAVVAPAFAADDVLLDPATVAGMPTDVGFEVPEPRISKRKERRLAGIPRRLTFRVLAFAILLLALIAAAYGLIRWYATDAWFVTVKKSQIVVYQGRPGGFLWFPPKLVDKTGVQQTAILSSDAVALREDVVETSLGAAKKYVRDLVDEARTTATTRPLFTGSTTTSTFPILAGTGATTTTVKGTTTVPSSTTTTAPATTTTTTASTAPPTTTAAPTNTPTPTTQAPTPPPQGGTTPSPPTT